MLRTCRQYGYRTNPSLSDPARRHLVLQRDSKSSTARQTRFAPQTLLPRHDGSLHPAAVNGLSPRPELVPRTTCPKQAPLGEANDSAFLGLRVWFRNRSCHETQCTSVGHEYHTLMRIERAVTSGFTNEELRARSAKCSGKEAEGLLLFRVSTNDQECGLVLLNTEEDQDSLWIEELWIPSDLRCRGLGSAILGQADEVATSLGRSKLAVWAEPLDDGDDD